MSLQVSTAGRKVRTVNDSENRPVGAESRGALLGRGARPSTLPKPWPRCYSVSNSVQAPSRGFAEPAASGAGRASSPREAVRSTIWLDAGS